MKSDSLYDVENVAVVHHINQGLRAHKLFEKDTDYIAGKKITSAYPEYKQLNILRNGINPLDFPFVDFICFLNRSTQSVYFTILRSYPRRLFFNRNFNAHNFCNLMR